MQIAFQGKKALVRVDFNVPLDKQYQITDDTRMRAAIPTLKHILDSGGSIILMSHLGRPDKALKESGSIPKEKFTLRHLVPHLSELLGVEVLFCEQTIGPEASRMAADLQPGQVLMLENTRFEAGETKGDARLAEALAALGDVYINDAFGTAHREHSSTATIARYFDKDAKSFGYLMEAELANARKILENPPRPLCAIIGGAKVSDKILLLESMLKLVDRLIIGGGMAYTFIKAQGGHTGQSLVESNKVDLAGDILRQAAEKGVEILLPVDSVVADSFSAEAAHRVSPSAQVPEGWMGLDIGPEATEAFRKAILDSKAILWNGPMGVFEFTNFANGTRQVALAVAEATEQGAYSLVGGGDSVAAVQQMDLGDRVSYVSTGGGAMLELLEGKTLPGVAAMEA